MTVGSYRTHFESFYLPEYVAMQKRFFDRYLKGIENGWEDEPKVQIAVRGTAGTHRRMEHEWPLARTIWQKWYLDAAGMSLDAVPPAEVHSVGYQALGDGLGFSTQPFAVETELTGPVMRDYSCRHRSRIWISMPRFGFSIPPGVKLCLPGRMNRHR